MTTIFEDSHGLVLIGYLVEGKTNKGIYYESSLFP